MQMNNSTAFVQKSPNMNYVKNSHEKNIYLENNLIKKRKTIQVSFADCIKREKEFSKYKTSLLCFH